MGIPISCTSNTSFQIALSQKRQHTFTNLFTSSIFVAHKWIHVSISHPEIWLEPDQKIPWKLPSLDTSLYLGALWTVFSQWGSIAESQRWLYAERWINKHVSSFVRFVKHCKSPYVAVRFRLFFLGQSFAGCSPVVGVVSLPGGVCCFFLCMCEVDFCCLRVDSSSQVCYGSESGLSSIAARSPYFCSRYHFTCWLW